MNAAAVFAVFVVAFALRWTTLATLSGDDHWALATAASLLHGDLPLRDLGDGGSPLQFALSALAQAATGYRVIGEVLLGATFVGLAFAMAFHLAWRASGSAAIAALLTALGLILMAETKLYSYPKTFLYPFVLWLSWRYIDRATLPRASALAAGVAITFLFRHDHGAYTGIGAAAAVCAAHWREGWPRVAYGWMRFGAALLLFVAPYLVAIQLTEGLIPYIEQRARIARQSDAGARRAVRFTVDGSAPEYWFRITPPRPARVFVEWKPDLPASTRIALERQYSLTNGGDPKKVPYEYALTNVSRDNLTALTSDVRITDRSGISVSYRGGAGNTRVIEGIVATETPPPDAPPGARAMVEIQWNNSLTESERSALERQYGLLDYRTKWEYALADVSTGNIRALVTDPRAADTSLLDRDTYRPMEESSFVRLQRMIPLLRISIAPKYWHRTNAGILLHDISIALPRLLLALLVVHWIRGRIRRRNPHSPAGTDAPSADKLGEKTAVAAIMMAVAFAALLRREGYFADHAAATAILAACLAAQWPVWRVRLMPLRLASALVAGAVMVLAASASVTYATAAQSIASPKNGLRGLWDDNVREFRAHSTSPPIDAYAPRGSTGDRGVMRYVYECTRPDDRIWVLTDLFTFPYYAERKIVGHVYWSYGFLNTPESQRKTIAAVDRQEVPLIIGLGGARPLQNLEAYPLVHDYAAQRYLRYYTIPEETTRRGGVFWLLTDSRRTPTGTYEPLGLPCFK